MWYWFFDLKMIYYLLGAKCRSVWNMVAARPSETRRYMYGIRPALSTTIFCVKKKNCGCGAAELCLTSRWSDRQGAKPEDGGTSLKHGFGDAEQEQLGCSLVRHLRSRLWSWHSLPVGCAFYQTLHATVKPSVAAPLPSVYLQTVFFRLFSKHQ